MVKTFLDNVHSEINIGFQSLNSTGHIIDANVGWQKILGYTPDEVLGTWFGDLLDDEGRALFQKNFNIFKKNGMINGAVFNLRSKSGEYIKVSFDGKILYNKEGDFEKTFCIFNPTSSDISIDTSFLNILNHTAIPMLILSPEDGVIVDVNKIATQFYGYSYKEMLNMKISDLNVLSHAECLLAIQDVLHSTMGRFRFIHRMSSGELKNIEGHPSTFYIDGNQYLILFIIDVTKEVMNEKTKSTALELSKKLLNRDVTITDISDLVYQYTTELTNSKDGYVATIDPLSKELHVHTLSKMMQSCHVNGQKVSFLLNESNQYNGLYGHSLNTRTPHYTNAPHQHESCAGLPKGHIPLKNALFFPVLLENQLVGQIAVANSPLGYDDSHLLMIEEISTIFSLAIQGIRHFEEEIKFRQIFDSAIEGIAIYRHSLKDDKFYIVDLNKTGMDISKNDRSIIGKEIEDVFSGAVEMGIVDVLKNVSKTGKPGRLKVSEYKDDKINFIGDNHVFKLPNGLLVAMFRDVTELHLVQNELKEINEQLVSRIEEEVKIRRRQEQVIQEQKKLADMGQMINAIAHQWRQPINALGLYGQEIVYLAKANRLDDAFLDDFAATHMDLIQHLSDTIDDFRTFFKPDKEKTDFDIIIETIDLLKLIIIQFNTKNIKVNTTCICEHKHFNCTDFIEYPECKYHKTKINGYLGEFKQVLINLLYNAADAITEKFENSNHQKGVININIEGLQDTVIMTISDNGIGIPEQNINKIFEPYFSTKKEGEGSGLGLYMTKLVVENHMNGDVRVENNSDGGASFSVQFHINGTSDA